MNQSSFAHLHSHTEFSLLDGSNRIRDYLDRVKELGMESAAITDTASCTAWWIFINMRKRSAFIP